VNARKLGRLILQSLRRNTRDIGLSSIGIVVGISTLLFFTALGSGIKSVVLEEIFVVKQLEVVPKSYDVGLAESLLGGDDKQKGLTDETVAKLKDLPNVEAAYPKMKLSFPSSVRGGKELLGQDLMAELVADGIPPRLVDPADTQGEIEFADLEAERSCQSADDCHEGFSCQKGVCTGKSCTVSNRSDVCTGSSYCDTEAGRCRLPIPVIASPRLLEIYNGSLHTALGGARGAISKLPKLTKDDLVGFEVNAIFGKSYLGRSTQGDPFARRLRLVGFSERAIQMGVTMPIEYVRRLNSRFRGESAGQTYHAIIVETSGNDAVARVAQTIRNQLDLELSDRYENAQRAGLLIMVMTLVFNLISLIILTISAVNIMHTFLMILLERRRELGLMRALGATKANIRMLILGESTIVGLIGGTLGLLTGAGAIWLVDYLFATQIWDFPFKPDSLFALHPWMLLAALGAALLFCWIGALIPAFRASQIDPAESLSGR
jgi:ABC-type antimicrobial peptide transport system permease subunit